MNCSQPFSLLGDPQVQNALKRIHDIYSPALLLILLILTVFSLLSNVFIVTVLVQPEMKRLGVNNMMTAMAICNFLCTVSVSATVLSGDTSMGVSLVRALIPTFCFYLAVAFHALSIHIAVGMAFCRIMTLKTEGRTSEKWQGTSYAFRLTVLLFLFTFSVSIPYGLLIKIDKKTDGLYSVGIVLENGCSFLKSVFMINAVVLKMIPCLLIASFSITILKNINESRRRKKKTLGSRVNSKLMDRSSDLILAILVIFLITEVPQVCFSLFGAVFTEDYYLYAGPNVGSLFDTLTLLNSASSIVIYCLLSSKFRSLFCKIFLRKIKRRTTTQSTTDISMF